MPRAEEDDQPCRACSDFKTWAKKQGKAQLTPPKPEPPPPDCPLDKHELGRATWGFLHSLAAYFPEKPDCKDRQNIATFFTLFAEFYPCEPCAKDFREDIKKNPPRARCRAELVEWLCQRHNTVNKKLGKPEFDCTTADERWRDGWKDGSCG